MKGFFDIGFKVILGIVAAVVGYQFSYQKQQNEDIQVILDLLSDESSKKRALGIEIASLYNKKETYFLFFSSQRISDDLFVTFNDYITYNDPEKSNRLSINTKIAVAAESDSALKEKAKASDALLPARIYFHVARNALKARAREIELNIEGKVLSKNIDIVIPGIEVVSSVPRQSELRCFKEDECEKYGNVLVKLMQEAGTTVKLKNLSKQYPNAKIRPRHFEIWFAEGEPSS